jgi:hypothetical protein
VRNHLREKLCENAAIDFSLKGCQKVAGGRSVAQTTGKEPHVVRTPEGCLSDTRSGYGIIFDCRPVVCATLRPTGYYLPARQAVKKTFTLTAGLDGFD